MTKALMRALQGVLSGRLRQRLVLTYMRCFRPSSYRAYRDYVDTDERQKSIHIMEALNYVRVADLPRSFFEFGCHSGRTFSAAIRAANHLGMADTKFFAFDSFQGLPETVADEDGTFETGAYATTLDEFRKAVKRLSGESLSDDQVVPGFYSESLTGSVRERLPHAGVVHIDVDLYSSTREVLDFLGPLLVSGTVLIFDDWFAFPAGSDMGERRALMEFLQLNPGFSVEEWKAYAGFGKSFFVTAVPAHGCQEKEPVHEG